MTDDKEVGYIPKVKSKKKRMSSREANAFFQPPAVTYLHHGPDHTDPIWDKHYYCIVPQIATYTEAELKTRLTTSGIQEIDERSLESAVRSRMTIDEMIEVMRSGYEVTIWDRKTILEVYAAIQRYLEFWSFEANTESVVHHMTVPTEDLRDLDTFAQELYLDMVSSRFALSRVGQEGGTAFGKLFRSSTSNWKTRREERKDLGTIYKEAGYREGLSDLYNRGKIHESF